MRAGRRDRKIRIERLSITKDDVGSDVETWTKVASVWAEFLPSGGNESIAAQQILGQSTIIFSILYRDDVTLRHRVVYEGENYDIKNIGQVGRRRGLKLTCKLIDEN